MKKHKLKFGVKLGLIGISALILIALYLNLTSTKVKPVLNSELGQPIGLTAQDFFTNLKSQDKVIITSDLSKIDVNVLGSTEITLSLNGKTYSSMLTIVDTTAPTAMVQSISVEVGSTITPDQLVVSVSDLQSTTLSFKSEPKLSGVGETTATVVITDASQNRSEYPVVINVVFDLTPPVITFERPLYVQVGSTAVDYFAGVTITDMKSAIQSQSATDTSVKLNRVGDYSVTLKAVDSAGNEVETERKVSVVVKTTSLTMNALEDPANDLSDEAIQAIFDQIITNDMTLAQKTRAIYDWMLEKLTYRTDYETAYLDDTYGYLDDYAQIMATTYKGHCFHYAAVAAQMLDKLGLEITLVKGEGYSSTAETHFVLHFWVMVKIDGHYYHFDPLYEYLYKVKSHRYVNFYMVKDSDVYDITHQWNKDLYPSAQ